MATRWIWPALAASAIGLEARLATSAEPVPGCPPDEWFCEEGEAPSPAAPEPEPEQPSAEPAEVAPPAPAPKPPSSAARRWTSDEGASPSIDVRRPPPARYEEQPRRPELSPWSLNLRVEGVVLGDGGSDEAGLGGGGASLRYLANPFVMLDLGLDSIVGTDHNGYERAELMLSLSSLLYFSRHPSVRSFAVLGFNASAARVDVGRDERDWNYLGVHAGLGLEVPLDRRVALNFDMIGFIRGRTDSSAAREPEFTDAFGRVTNTAGGGLVRAGINLYW